MIAAKLAALAGSAYALALVASHALSSLGNVSNFLG